MRTQPLFSIDSRSLTLFRISICLWTFRDLYTRIWYLEAWHTDDGVLQPHMTPHKSYIHQILFYRGPWQIQLFLFTIHFIITCNLLIGYKTSLSSLLHFIFTISIQERMYYVLDGGDRLFRNLCFWLILLPSWHGPTTKFSASIDAILIQNKRKKALAINTANKYKQLNKKTNNSNNNKSAAVLSYSIIRSYATAAILIQSVIIYVFIMLNRWRGTQQTWYWHKCNAVHNSMAAYTMSNNLGMYLAGYPYITFSLCRITIIFEWIFPLLMLIIPYDTIKIIIIALLFAMQIAFNLFIRIENFIFTATASLILFLPPLFWDWFNANIIQRSPFCKAMRMKLRYILINMARIFQLASRVSSTASVDNENDNVIHTLLWDIPLISTEEEDKIIESKDICLLNPIPSTLNKFLSIFFLIYLFINNFGDVQLRLFRKPDGGNIGELLRIDQQWVMYGPDVSNHIEFDLLIAEIEYNINSSKEITQIVLNDLLTSNWKSSTIFGGINQYKRPWNPTYINPSMRWERFFSKIGGKRFDMRKSVLLWFCKHTNGKLLTLNYQNPNIQYDDGVPIKSEKVFINQMLKAKWCTFKGDIVDMWIQNTTFPQYKNEYIRCFPPISC